MHFHSLNSSEIIIMNVVKNNWKKSNEFDWNEIGLGHESNFGSKRSNFYYSGLESINTRIILQCVLSGIIYYKYFWKSKIIYLYKKYSKMCKFIDKFGLIHQNLMFQNHHKMTGVNE